MKKIVTAFANFTESTMFITAMAHFWFAWALVMTFPHWYVLLGLIIVAAVKEYVFDLRFEQSPPQTIWDSTTDFIEYTTGGIFAYLLIIF
jgi:hypothetical protein